MTSTRLRNEDMTYFVFCICLQKSIEESGLEPIQPKGFIYHETRCGSTLVANMLAALPPSRVFSESKPPVQVLMGRTSRIRVVTWLGNWLPHQVDVAYMQRPFPFFRLICQVTLTDRLKLAPVRIPSVYIFGLY